MSSNNYTIRPYSPADAPRLAVMWNESDDQWPGTFTEGVPMTEERVRDWLESEKPLQGLLVETPDKQAIVAYGAMFDKPGQESTAYVDLLNVHPAYQGRSLCRRILTRMIDWALNHDYHRLTIGTWSANLKAVPLYKKTGFFWVPETQVHMENYIPAIRRLSVAEPFFARHNWYTTFKRELKQTEDEEFHPATGKMKVFINRWEADGQMLEAVIDRKGESVTGIETNFFAAYAMVDESEPAQGIAYPVRWRIVNKRNEPVEVRLRAQGEAGIEINHRSAFVLGAAETTTVEGSVTCAVDAPPLTEEDKNKPAPRIQTQLIIGPDEVVLGTGLRYHPAIEISCEPEIPSLLPGQSRTLHLQLRNRLPRPLRGGLNIAAADQLVVEADTLDFQVGAGGYARVPVTVTCGKRSTLLSVTASFNGGDGVITTAPRQLPLLVASPGDVAALQVDKKLLVENDFFRFTMQAKGGESLIWDKALQMNRLSAITAELGPPFYPHDLIEKDHTFFLDRGLGWAKATMRVQSERNPGVMLVREILITASALVQIRQRIENSGDRAHTLQLQNRVRFSDARSGQYLFARREGLITMHCEDLTTGDFPEKPAGMAEQWLARIDDGVISGIIWPGEVAKHKFEWRRLFMNFPEVTLEPGQSIALDPVYLYNAPGDWGAARRIWQRLDGQSEAVNGHRSRASQPQKAYRFHLACEPLITLAGRVETTIKATTARERQINGCITVEPPAGWALDQAEMSVNGLVKNKSLAQRLTLTARQTKIGAATGRLHLQGDLFDETHPFTLIRLGDERQRVQTVAGQSADDKSLITLDNGRQQWVIAPNFHAGLVAWREEGESTNHLYTTYPEAGHIAWLKPGFGGLRPILNWGGEREEGWPGKLHEERFTATPIDAPDAHGLPWRGLQLVADLQRKDMAGLRAEIAYLTVGGSNVLKVVFRVVNQTNIYRHLKPGLMTFLQVDGTHHNGVLYSATIQRKRSPQMFWPLAKTWGAVTNPDTGKTIVAIAASTAQELTLCDWGVDGAHLVPEMMLTLKPQAGAEMVTYFVLAGSLEEAKRYTALAKL